MKVFSRRAVTGVLVTAAVSLSLAGNASAGQDLITGPGGGWVAWQLSPATTTVARNITAVTVQVVLGHACANAKDASNGATYTGSCTGANNTVVKPFCGCVARYGQAYSDQVTGWGPNGTPQANGVYSFVGAWTDY